MPDQHQAVYSNERYVPASRPGEQADPPLTAGTQGTSRPIRPASYPLRPGQAGPRLALSEANSPLLPGRAIRSAGPGTPGTSPRERSCP